MAGTLADLALQSTDTFERAAVERFKTTSDLLQVMPFKRIDGMTYKYRQQEVLPGVAFRDVNQGYVESTGILAPRTESVMIAGGDVFLDIALLKLERSGGDAYDYQASQYDMKSMALARELERAIIEGDDLVNPSELMGWRRRLTGNQVIQAAVGVSAPLTVTMVDTLLDALDLSIGTPHVFMSKRDRRTFTTGLNALGGSVNITYRTINDLGKVVENYYGAVIHVVEDGWDASTVLGKDEDPGNGTANCSSMYAVIFDENMGVCGLLGGGQSGPVVSVREVGETTASGTTNPPGIVGRIECYPGQMIKAPRAAARLRNIA